MSSGVFQQTRIALAVEEFLPYSQAWIWRQLNVNGLRPDIILTKKVSNNNFFNFNAIFVGKRENRLIRKVKKKLWFIFRRRQPTLTLTNKKIFKKALIENQISLVHVHFGTFACELLDLCRGLEIPMIVTFHAFDVTAVPIRWPGYREKLIDLFSYISKAIAIAHYVSNQLSNLGCSSNKIKVNYLGVSVEEIPVIDRRFRQGPLRFVHIGRITEKKGVLDLVEVFLKTFKPVDNVELVIIGSGEEYEKVKLRVDKNSTGVLVVLKEAINPNRVIDELGMADVFVLNSRTDSNKSTEGLPITLLEAMATGLPVVSTSHAGIPEALSTSEGFLVSERDNKALAMALRGSTNRLLNYERGISARELVERKFSAIRCNLELKEIYSEILSE
jgi:colanic acid/amylovoran biosynthesis glycosyltransferase